MGLSTIIAVCSVLGIIFALGVFTKHKEERLEKRVQLLRWMGFLIAQIAMAGAIALSHGYVFDFVYYGSPLSRDVANLLAVILAWLIVQIVAIALILSLKKNVMSAGFIRLFGKIAAVLYFVALILFFILDFSGSILLQVIVTALISVLLNTHFYFCSVFVKGQKRKQVNAAVE